jgi:sulfur-carrier protein
VRLVYFAYVREAIGADAEQRDFPASVITIADCIDWLSAQEGNYASAFADRTRLRFALDQQMAKSDARLENAAELAIFPPVTGG